jgi:hypothetical protein
MSVSDIVVLSLGQLSAHCEAREKGSPHPRVSLWPIDLSISIANEELSNKPKHSVVQKRPASHRKILDACKVRRISFLT